MRTKLKAFVGVVCLCLLVVAVQAQRADVVLDGVGTLETSGTLTAETPFVEYRVRVLEGGTLDADMRQAQDSILDTKLFLVNARDEIILQNDDCDNDRTRSCLTLNNMTAGEYRVIATRFSDKKLGDYTLKLTLKDSSPPPFTIDVSDEALKASGYPLGTPEEETAWTIFAYYGGDTDLERAIIEDLEEFEIAGGSNANVRVIAFLDRSLVEFVSPDPEQEWYGARVYKLTASDVKEKDRRLESPMLFELNDSVEVNSADGETLAQFLVWGIRTFPSQRYAVAFASHGEGWAGLVPDYSKKQGNRAPMITVPELKLAFEAAQAELRQRGIEKFEVVINDACLMSSVEYHNPTMPYFNYSVASPEIVLNPALDMGLMLTLLTQNPDLAMPELGRALVDYYINTDMEAFPSAEKNNMASAVIDLARIPALDEAIEAFASVINANPQAYVTTLGLARKNTYTYGAWNKLDQHIDLVDFMRQVVLNSNDPALLLAAQEVVQAAKATVVVGEARSKVPNPSYLNIYFPSSIKSFANRYYVETPLPQWAQMLRDYYSAVDPQVWNREGRFYFHEPIEPSVKISQTFPIAGDTVSTEKGLTLSVEARGRKVARGWITIDRALPPSAGATEAQYVRLGAYPSLKRVPSQEGERFINAFTPGISFVDETWNGYLYTVSDGRVSDFELLESTASLDTAVLEGRYRVSEADAWKDGALIFGALDYTDDWTRKERRGQSIISRDGANSGLASILLPAGAQFQAYKSVVTADGGVERTPGKVYTWGKEGLLATETPAPKGEYRVTYLMESFGSQLGFDSVTVNVDNSNTDSVMRSYISARDGYLWRYDPTVWYDPVLKEQGWVEATYGQQAGFVEVYAYDDTIKFEDTPYGAALQYFSDINLTAFASDLGLTWQGEPVWQFEGQDAFGNFYAVAAIETLPRRFVVFGVFTNNEETPEEARDLRLEILADILDNVSAFPETFVSERANAWQMQKISDSFQIGLMPVLRSWSQNAYDFDDWLGFSPDDSYAESLTFVRVGQSLSNDVSAALQELLRISVIEADDTTAYEPLDYDKPIYYGETYTWNVAFYRRERNGTWVQGRMYVTRSELGNIYAVWFETPETDDDSDDKLFAEVFELMLDGFIVPDPTSTFSHPQLDLRVSYPKTWYYPEYDEEKGVYTILNPNLVTRLAIYTSDGVSLPMGCDTLELPLPDRCMPTPESIANALQARTGFNVTDRGEVVVRGTPMRALAYFPKMREGVIGYAQGLAFFSPTHGLAVLVAFETETGDVNAIQGFYESIQVDWLRLSSDNNRDTRLSDGNVFNSTLLQQEPTFNLYMMDTWTDFKTEHGEVTYNGDSVINATVRTAFSPSGQTAVSFVYVPIEAWQSAGIVSLDDFTIGTVDTSQPIVTTFIGAQYDEAGALIWEGREARYYAFTDEETNASGIAYTTFSPETYELQTLLVYGDGARSAVDFFAEFVFSSESFTMRYANDFDASNLAFASSYALSLEFPAVDAEALFDLYKLAIVPPVGWSAPFDDGGGSGVLVTGEEGGDGVFWTAELYAYEANATPIDVAFKVAFDKQWTLGQGRTEVIDGVPSLVIDLYTDGTGQRRQRGYLIVRLYDEVALVASVRADSPTTYPFALDYGAYCLLRAVSVAGASVSPCDWQSTVGLPLGSVWLAVPGTWDRPTYDSESNWWFGWDDAWESGVIVAWTLVRDSFEDTVLAFYEEYGLEQFSDALEPVELDNGVTVYEGVFALEDTIGQGFVFEEEGDYAYLVMLFSYLDDELNEAQQEAYTLIRDSVLLAMTAPDFSNVGNFGLNKRNYDVLYQGTVYEDTFAAEERLSFIIDD